MRMESWRRTGKCIIHRIIHQEKKKIITKREGQAKMCKVIVVANQKGGCSKTSVVANLGAGLAREGKRVCCIDSDP